MIRCLFIVTFITYVSGGQNIKISCVNFQAQKYINNTKLHGGWVAIESMSTTKKASEEKEYEDICIHSEILNITSDSLTMLSELHNLNGKNDDISIAKNDFIYTEKQPGIWLINSPIKHLKGGEMLVTSTDYKSYLVLSLCLSLPGTENRFLSSVILLSRRNERGTVGSLTIKELKEIKQQIEEKLNIKYDPIKYKTSC